MSNRRENVVFEDNKEDEDFEIWPELLGDKHFVLSLLLCDCYLNNDLTWPWSCRPETTGRRGIDRLIRGGSNAIDARDEHLLESGLKGWPNITKLNTGMIGCVQTTPLPRLGEI